MTFNCILCTLVHSTTAESDSIRTILYECMHKILQLITFNVSFNVTFVSSPHVVLHLSLHLLQWPGMALNTQ